MDDFISRQQAIDAVDEWFRLYAINRTMSNVTSIQDVLRQLPSARQDRSLWFRIGEICVDESKGFMSAGRAVEKIRELLREAERRTND